MRKSDKKIDKLIREVLTKVCEDTLKGYDGFIWVTHRVEFSSFPQSLKITCVFETKLNRTNFLMGDGQQHVITTLLNEFNRVGVHLKNVSKQITYETR
ncbi:hypothetical protein VTH8203_03634 [Vibrio thalassae]|uniref:Fis family transcriptional regulator n=1 Tax=Vibrio thalassae TaxID=1243014 RepID=A0A240EN04_9VIBR|nr:Fis family transcriptional regulator [Vibrio thalassae]SNX49986.1 hypothetical protein VTH8203_03634 [Vibrio thalassae]